MGAPNHVLRRVTLLTIVAALASAGVVTLCSSLFADALLTRADDRRMKQIVHALTLDVRDRARDSQLHNWFMAEIEDVAPAGFHLTLFEKDEVIVGMPLLRPHHVGECETQMLDDEPPWRVCSESAGSYTLAVAKSHASITEHRSTLVFSSLLAMLAAGAVAVLTNRRISMLLRQLDAAMAKSQRFAADAAHEMRTPLAMLSAELELLSESRTLDGPDALAVRKSRATVEGLNRLVERLLVLATEPARAVPLREVVSISEVLEAVLADCSPEQRARVTVVSVDELATVRGDFTLLKTMFGNALDNALKFSSTAVTVDVVDADAEWSVLVRDRGPGIEAASLSRVFEAFYRAPRVQAAGIRGYGIGLALIAHIARVHGGVAEFLPSEVGATLRIRLLKLRSPAS